LGLPVSLRTAAARFGLRGIIAVVVVLLHGLAFIGLMLTRLVEVNRLPSPRETVLTLVSLPPLAAKPPPEQKTPGPAAPLPDFRVLYGPYATGSNAITIRIPDYAASGLAVCPSSLKPGSEAWKRRCPWLAKAQKPPPDESGYEDFALTLPSSPAFAKWEQDVRKRNQPMQSPCAYVRTDPATGTKSNMTDIGCSLKSLFGR